ncbi:MAG: hypothetical protein ACLFST_04395 [Spirochaetia bacterium]
MIARGLKNYGLPPEEACEYIHSTCVEITPAVSSGVWVASPYINLLNPLLENTVDRETLIAARNTGIWERKIPWKKRIRAARNGSMNSK